MSRSKTGPGARPGYLLGEHIFHVDDLVGLKLGLVLM